MSKAADIGSERRIARFSSLLGLGISAVGLLVLWGWAFDIASLKSLLPGLPTMRANAAAAFVLIGACLWLPAHRADAATYRPIDWVVSALAALVVALGLLTLAEYAFGWNAGIDQMLYYESLPSPPTAAPGRMAPMTAVNLTLLGAALLLIDITTRGGKRPSNWLALGVAASSFVAILGYLYGVDALYRVAALASMALHTAILFVVCSIALVCAKPGSFFVGQIMGDTAGGLVTRRLLPAAILMPPFVGWLRLQGEQAGYYSGTFGLAIFAASNVMIFTALVWWSARTLQRVHEQRIEVSMTSAWQQAILNSADFAMISTDLQGVIRTINAGAASMLGYATAELVGSTTAIIHDPAEVAARAQALSQELGCPVEPGFDAFVAKARRGFTDENDWSYIRKDGSRFPVRLSVTALTDPAGMLTGFLGIAKDISVQKIAEEALRDSEQRLHLITDSLPAVVAYIDREQRYQFANAMAGQTVGAAAATMIGRTIREIRGEADYSRFADKVARALRGEHVSFEHSRLTQGRELVYHSIYVPDVQADGNVRGFYAMGFDITDLKAAEKRLAASEARLQTITDNVPALISYIDREHRFRFNNSTYARWLGRPLAEITGRKLDEVYDAPMYALFRPHLEQALTGTPATFEFASPALGRFIRGTYIPDVNSENEVIGVYGFINDISMQQEIEAKLRQLAQYDSLTGLANRGRLNDKLAEAIARSERSGEPLALVFLDLDRFKSINDDLGHQGGDLVLQEFAKRLSHCVRATDTVARLAGDEFVIILESLKRTGDEGLVAAKIVAAMKSPFQLFNEQRAVSTSMGIAVRRPGETDSAALLQRADAALYKVKASGRGRFLVEV